MLRTGEIILMENKIENFEKVIENKNDILLKIDNFEGPLELLLYLIDKKKLKISEVRISQLIDEYLAILERSKKDNLEIKVEFLLTATELLEIKAMSVLHINEEMETEKALKQRLEDYKLFKDVADKINNMGSEFNISYSRKEGRKIRKTEAKEYDLNSLKVEDIFNSYKKYLKVVDEDIIEIKYEKIYSVEEEIEKIKVILFEKPLSLDEIFSRAENKIHLVYIFLALLDIYKEGKIDIISQENKKIFIKKIDC